MIFCHFCRNPVNKQRHKQLGVHGKCLDELYKELKQIKRSTEFHNIFTSKHFNTKIDYSQVLISISDLTTT